MLIINADDFGLCEGVNLGIIDGFQAGAITSTSFMITGEASEHARQLALQNPELKVGIHLTLTSGKPITDVPSLVDETGYFKLTSRFEQEDWEVNLDEVEQEWVQQIERFYNQFQFFPNHIDSHHHIHGWSKLHPVIIRLAKRYSIPFRHLVGIEYLPIKKRTSYFNDQFYGENIELAHLKEIVTNYRHQTLEIMCHPGYEDAALRRQSSYVEERRKELQTLKEWIKEEKVSK